MLLVIALVVLCYLMAMDTRRSVADYGLVADKNWARHGVVGLAAGVVFYAGYCAAAGGLGVFAFSTEGITLGGICNVAIAAVAAVLVAVVQQIIFSGYLASTLRGRFGLAVAILAPSLLFGLLSAPDVARLMAPTGSRLAIGLFFVGALLCTLRLKLGSLALPAGILAGCILVRRATRKLDLLEFHADADWALWLAPAGDPRQGPVMWAAVAIAWGAALVWLWRKGEHQQSPDQPAIDASFKRIMPFSNMLGMGPIDLWLAKLWQARFRIGLKYLPRLVVTLIASTINTVLTLPERILAPIFIRHDVPDPVFIVGVHRSGTTHLHNLLALDPRFCTPRNYQVFNPHGFLTGWLTTLVLGPFLSWKRPMDSMQLTAFSPQEEDFATAMMTRHAPYWSTCCLPRLFRQDEKTIYPERMSTRGRAAWAAALTLFLRKITFWSRKSPLLKSPYNTARVAALREMFPTAKFVHICRHPHATYRSNMHLAEHGFAVFQLQTPDDEYSFASQFLTNYRDQEDAFYAAVEELPDGDFTELRFEDLEENPLVEVRRIYAELGWEMTPEVEQKLTAYLDSIAGYKKNRFRELPPATQDEINDAMGEYLQRWGYIVDTTSRRSAA